MVLLLAATVPFAALAGDFGSQQLASLEQQPTVASQVIKMKATDVFALADQARKRGDLRTAEAAYRALAEDPDQDVRAEALFRHGVMLAQSGNLRDSALLLRLLLDERPQATAARLELASVLDRLGDKDAAYREIRAAQAAGLPPAVARLVDQYSASLRAARSAGAGFEIAIAPDSNINRSTRSDMLQTIFGDFDIGEESMAKSGLGLALRGHAFRRFPLSRDISLVTRGAGSADLYGDHRFNDIAVDLAGGAELHLGRSRVNLELAATSRWFGLRPFMRSARIGALLSRPIDQRTQVRFGATAAFHNSLFNDLQDGKGYSVQASVERALSPVHGVALTGSGERFLARDDGYSTTAWRAGLIGWREIDRATVTLGAEIGQLRADERLQLFPEKRIDNYRRLTLGATFRHFTFGGFAPLARLTFERNRSSIEFHDFRRTRTEVGISRAF
jgi:outer membrane protein